MKEKLSELEKLSSALQPGSGERKRLLAPVFEYSDDFLNRLPAAPAYKPKTPENDRVLTDPLDEDGMDIQNVLSDLETSVDSGGLNPASGNHYGYIPGGGIYTSALGDYLAAVSNRYAGVYASSPGAVNLEKRLCNWMAELIGFPPDTSGGYLASGGSIANLTAIVAARDFAGITSGRIEKSVVYLTAQSHHCIDKALAIAGLGKCIIRRIPMDENYRMISEKLDDAISEDLEEGLNPWLVVASAGTTDTGAIDPLSEIAGIADKNRLWFHVDAAYGGFFLLCDDIRDKIKGIEKADSVVLDPHKGLFLPYGIGALVVKDIKRLRDSFHFTASYMQDADEDIQNYSPAEISPELSKHFRGLRMWVPLKLHGIKAFRAAIEEKLLLARHAWNLLNATGDFEMGPEPELSIFTFRYLPESGDPDEFNRQLHKRLLEDGRIFLSTTLIDGAFMFRFAVLSVRTHKKEVESAVGIIRELAGKCYASAVG